MDYLLLDSYLNKRKCILYSTFFLTSFLCSLSSGATLNPDSYMRFCTNNSPFCYLHTMFSYYSYSQINPICFVPLQMYKLSKMATHHNGIADAYYESSFSSSPVFCEPREAKTEDSLFSLTSSTVQVSYISHLGQPSSLHS